MAHLGRRVVGLAVTLSTSAPLAHGLDANRVQVVLRGDAAEAVATVPVEFLGDIDRDRDGLLTLAELSPRRAEARDRLVAALDLRDDHGRAGEVVRADVSLPRDGAPSLGRDFVRLTVVRRWTTAPRALSLRCAFVDEHPVAVFASRAVASGPGRLSLLGRPEARVATSATTRLDLLRVPAPPAPRPSPAPYFALGLASAVAVALWRRRSLAPTTDGAPT